MSARVLFESGGVQLRATGARKISSTLFLQVSTPFGDATDTTLNRYQVTGLRDALNRLAPKDPLWAVPYEDPPEGFWILEVRAPNAKEAGKKARAWLDKNLVRTHKRIRIGTDRIRRAKGGDADIVERGEEVDYDG